MRCGRLTLMCLVLVTPAFADDEASKHQGTWAVTSSVRDGKEAPAEVVGSIRRVVEGDHVTWTRDGKSFAGTKVEYDARKTPHALDLIPDGGPNRDKRILGIYKLEGDALTICVADPDEPRPTTFEAPAGSKRTLQSFKKSRSEPKPEYPVRVERARLQGTWAITATVSSGRFTPADQLADESLVVKGDRMIYLLNGKESSSSKYELDPAKSPAQIDIMPETGRAKGGRILGIYRIEGDDLMLSHNHGLPMKPRPSDFEARQGELFLSFRRIDR